MLRAWRETPIVGTEEDRLRERVRRLEAEKADLADRLNLLVLDQGLLEQRQAEVDLLRACGFRADLENGVLVDQRGRTPVWIAPTLKQKATA